MKPGLQPGWWRLAASFVIFQAAWLTCVVAAAHEAAGWGIAAVLVSISWQLAISDRPGIDLVLICAAFTAGLLWDSLLVQAYIVVYASPAPYTAVAPLWILALWMQLGSVLREPLRWLHGRPGIAAALGAMGGAAAYAGAARIGACEFPEPPLALAVLAAGWSVLLPLLLGLARRLERQRIQPA